MRVITLAQKTPDRELLKGLQSFVERDFSEYIVVAVSFDRLRALLGAGPAIVFLRNSRHAQKQNVPRTQRRQAAVPDGLPVSHQRRPGREVHLSRIVDERNFLNADSGSVRLSAKSAIKSNST